MPVGKRIFHESNLDDYQWFNMNTQTLAQQRNNIDWNDSDDDYANSWDTEVEYIMTENGLERTRKKFQLRQ